MTVVYALPVGKLWAIAETAMSPDLSLHLELLPGRYAVCRRGPDDLLAALPRSSDFLSVTRTPDELSIVLPEGEVGEEERAERGWRVLKVAGPLELAQVGVLASLAAPLAKAGVSIFAISTFDTDYLLVHEDGLERAVEALRAAGHGVGV